MRSYSSKCCFHAIHGFKTFDFLVECRGSVRGNPRRSTAISMAFHGLTRKRHGFPRQKAHGFPSFMALQWQVPRLCPWHIHAAWFCPWQQPWSSPWQPTEVPRQLPRLVPCLLSAEIREYPPESTAIHGRWNPPPAALTLSCRSAASHEQFFDSKLSRGVNEKRGLQRDTWYGLFGSLVVTLVGASASSLEPGA